jgi:AcrR family transcriptional regulator
MSSGTSSYTSVPVQPVIARQRAELAESGQHDLSTVNRLLERSSFGLIDQAYLKSVVPNHVVRTVIRDLGPYDLQPVGPLRRVPVQGRSVAKVARMLGACAELVDEMGYESLTTTLLAERAGVAIGSIYQFFPDKRAVVQALTLRNLEAYLGRMEARFTGARFAHWWDGMDSAIDEYIAMHRDTPGFRTLHFGDVVDVHLLDDDKDNNQVIASMLTSLMRETFGIGSEATVDFPIWIAVEIADALIKLGFRHDPAGDARVLTEAKSLIHSYLTQYVPA